MTVSDIKKSVMSPLNKHHAGMRRHISRLFPTPFHSRLLAAAVLMAAYLTAADARSGQTPLTLWYAHPAQTWMTSALPVGNGDIGAMFFGGVGRDIVQFNDKSLWSGSKGVRGSYQNFGHLALTFEGDDECTGYRRELSLDNAVGRVSFVREGTKYVREYFASAPDSAIIIRLSTPGSSGKLSFTLEMADGRGMPTSAGDNILAIKGKLDLICYEACAGLKTVGGTTVMDGSRIRVDHADAATIILTCGTNFNLAADNYTRGDAATLHRAVDSRLRKASARSYDELRSRHIEDYRRLFDRVELDFRSPLPSYPTDELVRNHKYNPYLDMLYFQFGRYLMISSSRSNGLPSNLQGLWNNVNTPPWECDYHSNINIQMNYWPAEVTNLSECHRSFIDYVYTEATKTNGSWQQVASGDSCRGWTVRTQSNAFGYTDWNINRPANAWYCTHLWQHYAYGLDKEYLRQTAWPVMKSACEYWFDRLVERNGKLVAPDDWSPEHGPWTDGPAYAQQLVSALFDKTLLAAEALGIDDGFVEELREKSSLTDNGLHVGEWGQLREWMEHPDDKTEHHRHLSHLMALYPGDKVSPLIDDTMAKAAIASLDARGDGGTGWSRAWKVACWARLGNASRAYHLLKQALNLTYVTTVSMEDSAGGVYENLLCAHPSFQIDGNFGATAGIAEMLLQNTVKGIRLLPALPEAWANGHFRGLRAKGGFTIGLEWNAGKPTTAVIYSKNGGDCRLFLPEIKNVRITEKGQRRVKYRSDTDWTVVFKTKKKHKYTILFQTDATASHCQAI